MRSSQISSSYFYFYFVTIKLVRKKKLTLKLLKFIKYRLYPDT